MPGQLEDPENPHYPEDLSDTHHLVLITGRSWFFFTVNIFLRKIKIAFLAFKFQVEANKTLLTEPISIRIQISGFAYSWSYHFWIMLVQKSREDGKFKQIWWHNPFLYNYSFKSDFFQTNKNNWDDFLPCSCASVDDGENEWQKVRQHSQNIDHVHRRFNESKRFQFQLILSTFARPIQSNQFIPAWNIKSCSVRK